jgi:hypothetical protein
MKMRKSKIHYDRETRKNIEKNTKNDKLMMQLLKAPCGLTPTQKGPNGWEKHALDYYKQKSKGIS